MGIPLRLLLFTILTTTTLMAAPDFDATQAARFAQLALDCVHKEYPNKIAHSLNSDADLKPPRELTPAFYGCYDWHSSVHGHWLLARLIRLFPDAPFAPPARAALNQSLTPAHIAGEVAYLNGAGRASFERPYGLAWLLQLSAELHEWNDPDAQRWAAALEPLEDSIVKRISEWLPKLEHPIRTGEHNNTAFSLGLMLDYARTKNKPEFRSLLETRAKAYYEKDRACPLAYEPGGEDFLSPCLAEADTMRRVLPRAEFTRWFDAFLPAVNLEPTKVVDFSDGKLYHLAGLNLSRAWMIRGILSKLPPSHPRAKNLSTLAARFQNTGLDSIKAEHYEGGHWLGSFAVYLVSRRGI